MPSVDPVATSRYRGVDRRTPAPAAETLPVAPVAAVFAALWLAIVALTSLVPSAARTVAHGDVAAGCFAVVAAVAMFVRWRIDGRAESWWVALGFVVIGTTTLVDSSVGVDRLALAVAASAAALVYFAQAWHGPEIDSILSVRRFVIDALLAVGLSLTAAAILGGNPAAVRIAAAITASAYAVLAVVWLRSGQDKPWLVLPLCGFAVGAAAIAIVRDPIGAAADTITAQLLVNAAAAATALTGLQALATRARALALDAQRERDLIKSLREELEARYAETLHEVRSTALALEGGVEVLRPRSGDDGRTRDGMTDLIVAELHRLRSLADPNNASVPENFKLTDALDPLVALSRTRGGRVRWHIPHDIVVRGKPEDVAQIVHSLLSNAQKYAPDGPVDVAVMLNDRFALVLVDDHGPGVRSADRERIFERGERADTEDREGHGLGLHIARRLARSLGGELWVERNPHGGARFVLALRRAPALAPPAPLVERSAS